MGNKKLEKSPAMASDKQRRHVVVLGGGVAGLTCAHELAERGYEVTVCEARALGGKARSTTVPGTGSNGRQDLPGEHGFRFFPGFYHNLPDTLRRIPFANQPNGVWDNLVQAPVLRMGFKDFPDIFLDYNHGLPHPENITDFTKIISTFLGYLGLAKRIPPHELIFYVEKILVFLTSCDARRYGQWEKMGWWEYTRAGHMSQAYQDFLGNISTGLVAARGLEVSTRTLAQIVEAFLYGFLKRNLDGPIDRVLNRPTDEAWITPWVSYLSSLGVEFKLDAKVTKLSYANGNITGATITDSAGNNSNITADWYVLAIPPSHLKLLLTAELIQADNRLANISQLQSRWMSGIQFFLTASAQITKGHFYLINSPWAVTGLSQAQFWPLEFAKTYGNGTIQDVVSVDISNWDNPGILYGKSAKQCTPDEIAREVLAQIRAWIGNGVDLIPDNIIHSYTIDPGLSGLGTPSPTNYDDLLINTPDSWQIRPESATAITNLYLAGDYIRATGFDLACMETANEGGRRAANAILDANKDSATRAIIYARYKFPLLSLEHLIDDKLYRLGLPNKNDLLHPYFPEK